MIYIIIFILCIAGILVIFLRKMPNLKKFDFFKIKNEAKKNVEESRKVEESKNIKKANFGNNFQFLQKKDEQADLFSEAEKLFGDKKYSQAEKILVRLIASDPQNVKYYNRLGVIYMEEKNFLDAKNAFGEAVSLDPKKAARHYNFAMACAELGELRNAIESLKETTRLDKKNKKYDKALKDLEYKVRYRYKEMKRVDD